jgi:hypothetical protein
MTQSDEQNIDNICNTIRTSVNMIIHNSEGYIKWSFNPEIRTMIHAFLFHYEHYMIGNRIIISGERPCIHGSKCPYKIAFHILRNINGDTNSVRGGCSFKHSESDQYFDFIASRMRIETSFIPSLRNIIQMWSDESDRNSRIFRLSNGTEVSLSTFTDDIFIDGKIQSEDEIKQKHIQRESCFSKLEEMLA